MNLSLKDQSHFQDKVGLGYDLKFYVSQGLTLLTASLVLPRSCYSEREGSYPGFVHLFSATSLLFALQFGYWRFRKLQSGLPLLASKSTKLLLGLLKIKVNISFEI